jgi:hypothetical protein
MDEDLKAALFEDVDDEGDFEELDDDFVGQVMQEPEEPDFDFDAHIANLLAKSERILGIKKARGWDDKEEMKKLTKKIDFEGEEDEEEDEYSEGDEVESWVEEEEEENMLKPKKSTGKKTDFTEEELEQLMAEYEDGQLGEMEDVDDVEFQGEIDFTNEEDPVLKQVLESYEQDQKDLNYLKGLQRKKGERSSARQLQQRKKIEVNEEQQEVDLKKANKEQVLLQKEWEEQIKEIDLNEKKEKVLEVMEEIEYLKEKKDFEEWDCETIISTYSTLDNHPTIIKDPKSTKFRPFNTLKKSRHHPQHPSQVNNTGDGSEMSSGSSRTNNNNNGNQKQPPITPGNNKILLTGKMNLPEGFSRYSQPKNSKYNQNSNNQQNQKNDRKSLLQEIQEDQGEEEEESSEEEEKDQENNSDEDSSEETKGRRKETPEEKQARKKKMKEERKKKRMNKKSLKTAFQKEGLKIIKSLGLEQSTDHVSVFKYST